MDKPCSPQLENGYTRIANELLDAIIRARLSRRQYAVLLAVARKTYGYNRKTARISSSQLAAMTGLDRANVTRTVCALVRMGVLVRNEIPVSRDESKVLEMGPNKHYDQWRLPGSNGRTRTRTDSDANAEITSTAVLPPLTDRCQNDTSPLPLQAGAKTTPPPFGWCQIGTTLLSMQIDAKTTPAPHMGAQMTHNTSEERQSDMLPSDERDNDACNGCQNDTSPPPLRAGAKTTPPPFGWCQNDTPPFGWCQIDTTNWCQFGTPPGANLAPPTVKDKKIKDNTKTTTPLSATQTSPHLRRGEAQESAAQPTTERTSACASDIGAPGVWNPHPETQATFPVETHEDHGGNVPGSEPNATTAVDLRMGADTLADHDAETPTEVSTNCAESPARKEPSADFTLSPPQALPAKRAKGRRTKPDAKRFDRFWAAYPRKRSKQQARAAFEHLAPDDTLLAHILESLERAKGTCDWRKENGSYIPYPATWLRAQGWLDEFAADAYTPAQFAVLEQYNTLMGEAGWPPAILAPYSAARASGIDDFLGFSPKPDMPERYFRYCARELDPHDGCGFDWLIRRNTFLCIREGVIAKHETRTPQWA